MKKEYFLLFAAIAVLSAYLMLTGRDRTQYELPEIPGVEKKAISKIEVGKKDHQLVLNRADDAWKIGPEKYPADPTKIEAMLDALSGLTLTAMVSESKTYDRFDLTDDKKIQVKGFSGPNPQPVIQFGVGKAAATRQHTFVLIPGDDRVYHGRGNFRPAFDADVDGLRDKTIFKIAARDINDVIIHKGGDTLMLSRQPIVPEKKDGESGENAGEQKSGFKWVSASGQEADQAELNKLFSDLSDVKCQKFIYDKPKDGFSNPVYTVTVKSDREYTLSVYEKRNPDDGEFPATSSENDSPFLLPKWTAEKIMDGFEKLAP